MNKGTKGAILASAVAALFLASAAMAQDSGSATSSGSAAQAASTKCVGGNSCKGQGSCKSTQNDCKGQNGCKGKGFVMTSSTDRVHAEGRTSGVIGASFGRSAPDVRRAQHTGLNHWRASHQHESLRVPIPGFRRGTAKAALFARPRQQSRSRLV